MMLQAYKVERKVHDNRRKRAGTISRFLVVVAAISALVTIRSIHEIVGSIHDVTRALVCTSGFLNARSGQYHRSLCEVETALETDSFRNAFSDEGNLYDTADYEVERPSGSTNIAFVVTVPSCPEDLSHPTAEDDPGAAFYDAAAVLRDSVCNCTSRNPDSGSKYDSTLYALIHPEAISCAGPTDQLDDGANAQTPYNYDRVKILEELGFWVLVWREPVSLSEISETNNYLKNQIQTETGIRDLMRLHAYNLTQHPVAVMMNFDTVFLNPVDSIVDELIENPSKKSIHFNKNNGNINAGTLFVKTSGVELESIVDHFKDTVYDSNTGWGESGTLGLGAEGILKHYFDLNEEANVEHNSTDSLLISFASEPACGKPWTCYYDDTWDTSTEDRCRNYHSNWFAYRKQFETRWSKTDLVDTTQNNYHTDFFLGFCTATGEEGYLRAADYSSTAYFDSEWSSAYAAAGEELIPNELSTISNFQPSMSTSQENSRRLESLNCPHQETGLVDFGSFNYPNDGSDITLSGSVLISSASNLLGTDAAPYGKIIVPVGSRLIFDDSAIGTIVLHTMGILVDGGSLEAGSSTCRIEGSIEIILHGAYDTTTLDSERFLAEAAKDDPTIKGIVIKNAGVWEFHGKLYNPTWTRLAAPIPGDLASSLSIPAIRNSEIFLQDCVDWPVGADIIITTSRVKDTRHYNFNEIATIASGTECVLMSDGKSYGKLTVDSPLEYYHHAGKREYQSEIGLLSRNIVVRGNDRSFPTDTVSEECEADVSGWNTMPCPGTYVTGFGGHTIIMHDAVGRLRGVEFNNMGMTNILGRYPIHFHHSTTGQEGYVTDCSVHKSHYRAITVHHTFDLLVARNVAYDITGHALYLEAGTEERNTIEYNLISHVHTIDGAILMTATDIERTAGENILIPADRTASCYYISNVHNRVIGNAASGGWAGINFPVLPEPADPTLRYSGVVPKDRTALEIVGNSVHSTGWFGKNTGAVYAGGSLYWDEDDTNSTLMKYNAGRIGSTRLSRHAKDDDGKNAWFRVQNTTVWLTNVGVTGWGKRSEYLGFEVHDFQQRGVFVLFNTWFDNIVLNCRTTNAPLVPDPGTRFNENAINDGTKWSGFHTYDHLMKHILTNWKISNCGGVARNLQPFVPDGDVDDSEVALFTVPVNGFAPEIQIVSKGTTYDFETLGGEEFLNQSIFFGSSGPQDIYSMQYMSNWEDSDGSMTGRPGVGSTVMGPARAGFWWNLDQRPGKCEVRSNWKFPQRLCSKGEFNLASMFTVVMPQKTNSLNGGKGSAVLELISPGANVRKTRGGSVTHFGLTGDSNVDACHPPAACNETMARSWDPDLTGPHEHSIRGGWHLQFDGGTPKHLMIERVQMKTDSTMIQSMNVPDGTSLSDVKIYASTARTSQVHNFTSASTLDEVRTQLDKFYLDVSTKTLFWRVIAGFIENDGTLGWAPDSKLDSFTRDGLTVTDYTASNIYQLNIEITCIGDNITGHFCDEQPVFVVPGLECPPGQVMVALNKCGPYCELNSTCGPQTPSPVPISTNSPAEAPVPTLTTIAPTAAPNAEPTPVIGSLVSNPNESPQVLSDFTDVCTSAQGRTSVCEVELDVPASCVDVDSTSACPIVFFLHGAGGTNNWFGRTSGVHSAGYIGIYPQGENGWNTGPKDTNNCSQDDFSCTSDPDEGAFFAGIISEVRSMGALGNVYVIGNSNGAALAHRLAVNAGDSLPIKGIITKVTQLLESPLRSGPGVLNYNNPAAKSNAGPKVSVLNVMGTADPVIPYTGGPAGVLGGSSSGFLLMDSLDSMLAWAVHNGCETIPSVTSVTTDTSAGGDGTGTFYKYSNCTDGTIVEHYAINGAGHTAGSSVIEGVPVDYALAFDFINRNEVGSGGGGGGGIPTPVPVGSSPEPTSPLPVESCVDDPTWVGKFDTAHTCAYVGENPAVRCNWKDINDVLASDACLFSCDPNC